MAKTSSRTTLFETTPEKLLEIVTSEDFQVEQRLLDEAVVNTELVEVSRSDDKLVFELRSKEYERGMKGLNRKKTISSTTKVEWDLKNKKATWSYSSPSIERFRLEGNQRIEPAPGDKAKFTAEFTVEVKVPLLGGKIEGKVTDGMNEGSQRYDDLLRKHIAKRG